MPIFNVGTLKGCPYGAIRQNWLLTADETDFWLNLLHDNGYLDDTQFNSLKKDIDRILKIMASIVKTMKEKIEGNKRK